MSGCDAAKSTPVNAVRSEADSTIEHETISGFFDRTVSESRMVEDLSGNIMVGSDDDTSVAKAESHESSCMHGLRYVRKVAVSKAMHEIDAANYRETFRTRDMVVVVGYDHGSPV